MTTESSSFGKILGSILLVLLGLLGLFMTVCGAVFVGDGMQGVPILAIVIGIAFIAAAVMGFSVTASSADARRLEDPPS